MGAPVGENAAGVVPDHAPAHPVDALRREGRPGRGAQPHVPIQIGGGSLLLFLVDLGVHRQFDLHVAESSDGAVAHGLTEPVVLRDGAILEAGLKDGVASFYLGGEITSFGDGQGGFLAEDVLASLKRREGDGDVPMVRRGDDDGVDVAALQQFAEIIERPAIPGAVGLVDEGLGGVLAVLEDVADSDGAAVLFAEEGTEVAGDAVSADADETEGDDGRRGSGQTGNPGSGKGSCGGGEKTAAADGGHGGMLADAGLP